jgi:kynurenine formamidase
MVQRSMLADALLRATVHDLTHPLSTATTPWPGNTPFSRTQTTAYGCGHFSAFDITLAEHTGTHIDAPRHLLPDGLAIDDLLLTDLVGPAALLDVEADTGGVADRIVPLAALERWEAVHGRVRGGSFVLVKTGWYRRFGDAQGYRGIDAAGVPHFPSLSPELANALVSRKPRAVCIDTLSPDAGTSSDPIVHRILLENQIPILENLANLDAVPAVGAVILAMPMYIAGGTGSPTRVMALLDQPTVRWATPSRSGGSRTGPPSQRGSPRSLRARRLSARSRDDAGHDAGASFHHRAGGTGAAPGAPGVPALSERSAMHVPGLRSLRDGETLLIPEHRNHDAEDRQ